MRIFVDADACPNVIKEILFRAAHRTRVEMVFVANRALRFPSSPSLKCIVVRPGIDEADRRILEMIAASDLVITSDIPLAAEAVGRGGLALTPRGELYTKDNARQALTMRNLMAELRGAGMIGGGPPSITTRERQAFAAHLDRILARSQRAVDRST
jgi:uncharacterized protein